MTRSFLFLLLLISIPYCVFAQLDTVQTAGPWSHDVVFGLTLTQVGFKDWSQGGESALSYTFSLEGKTVRKDDVTDWTNSYKLAFGQTRLSVQGLRKTDDKIDLESVVAYKSGRFFNPYAAATLKSQFATGYTYDQVAGTKTPVSRFFDPAYLTQSVGVRYEPAAQVKTRFGVAMREVITTLYTHYANNPATTTVERTIVNGGFESVTNVEWKPDEDILFTAKLELFSPFNRMDEIIVRSDNSLALKFNNYISVIVNVQFINDRRVTTRTQVKESLGLGLTYTLL